MKKIFFKILVAVVLLSMILSYAVTVNARSFSRTNEDNLDTMATDMVRTSLMSSMIGNIALIVIVVIVVVVIVKNVNKKKAKASSTGAVAPSLKEDVRDYKISSWGELIKIAIISGLFGAIGYLIADKSEGNQVFTYTFMAAGFPWGYSVMNKIIDDWVEIYFTWASTTLGFIVFIIKIALAFLLGAVIMPVKLIMSIYHIVDAQKISSDINKTEKMAVMEQQAQKTVAPAEKIVEPKENIIESSDERSKIKKVKQLYDEGLITKEEFEKKKEDIISKI